MARGNLMRLGCIFAGVAMAGLSCSPPPVPPVPTQKCNETTITFDSPAAGAMVDVPFAVSLHVTNPDGSAFAFDSAKLGVDGANFNGTVTSNSAAFAAVTAAAGARTLIATITQGTCSKNATLEVTVNTTACTSPTVTAVSFPQDEMAPLGTLSRAEIPPGTPMQVKVDASCVDGVQVRLMHGTTEVGAPTDFVDGTVTFTLASLPDADNQSYELFAELVRDGAPLNSAITPGASGTIQVSRSLPACAVTTMGSFNPADDVDPSTPGFQMRVAGTMDETSSGTLSVDGQMGIGVTPIAGEVTADFTLVDSRAYTVTLTCTDPVGNTNTVTGMFSFMNACTDPVVMAVSFPQDTSAPFGVLNRTEIPPGMNLQVEVNAECLGDGVQVRLKRGSAIVAPLTDFTAGTATMVVAGLPDADTANYELFAELVRDGIALNLSTTPGATGTIQIKRTVPACAVTTSGTFGPSDDADMLTPGFQMRVTGSMAATSTGTLEVTGEMPQPVTPSGAGDVSADFTLANSGTYTATLMCTDDVGNTNTATGNFDLDFDPPVIAITAPLGCGMELTTFSTTATATVTGAEGQTVSFLARRYSNPNETPVAVGSAVVVSGVASGSVTFPGIDSWVLIARVSDAQGNAAEDTEGEGTCSDGGTGGIVVNPILCTLNFTRPATSPATVLRPQVTNGNYGLNLSSSCPSTAVVLTIDGASPASLNTDVSGNVSFTVPAVDSSTFVYRACITNVSPAPATCTSVTVTYRLTQPVITAPSTGLILNITRDSSLITAGVQSQLAFSSSAAAATYVCSDQTPAPGGASNCPNGASGYWILAGGPSFSSPVPAFTFPDGNYNLTVVVQTSGGDFDTSDPRAIVADSQAPCVAAGLTVLGDNSPTDLALNAVELAAGVSARFTLGCGDTDQTIKSVKWTSGCGVGLHSQTSGVSFASGAYTVVLQQSTLGLPADRNFDFGILLTDIHDNVNVLCGVSPAPNADALFSLHVDNIAPTCSVVSPASSTILGLAADADGATGGFQVRVSLDTSADVATGAAVMGFTGAAPSAGSANRVGDRVTSDFTFAATGTDTVSIGATCTDTVGNVSTATAHTGIVVDRDPPTCTLVSPADGSGSSTFSIATRIDVDGAEGRTVTVHSGVTEVGTLDVSCASLPCRAEGPLSYGPGMQAITASVSDIAGNACTTAANTINVNAVGCSLLVVGPTATITSNNSTPAGAGVATIVPSAHSSNCQAGETVQLFRVLPGPRTLIGTATTNGSGDVTFSSPAVNVSDGTTAQFDFEIDNGAGLITTTSTASLVVDLSGPTVASTSPALANIFVVSDSNANVPSNPAYFVDAVAGAPGDISFTLTTVTGASGGSARVRLTTPSTVVGTQSIGASPTTVVVAAQFAQKTTGAEYVVEILDANGNVTEAHRGNVSVDVLAPGAPSFSQTFAAVTDARIGHVLVTIDAPATTPSYDDGVTPGSGAHAGYDIRWTTERQWVATLGARAGAPCLELSSDFFDSTKAVATSNVSWSASAIPQPLTLPPANRYCIVVRATDALGNYSTYVAPTVMNNDAREDNLVNPTATAAQDFGLMMASNGSLNNDATDDLVVSGPKRLITSANVGAVYVYFGGVGFGAQTTCTLPACQEIQPYDTAASGRFGTSLAVGDVGGDSSKPDLVVGSPFWSTSKGRVFVFFGSSTQATLDTTAGTFLEFRAATNNTRMGEMVAVMPGRAGQTLLAISAHTEPFSGATATNQGRVYLYRSRTLAEWQALQTGAFIPVNGTTADWVIDGPLPVDSVAAPAAGNQFARVRGGATGLGDINGDSVPDFAISMAKNTTVGNTVYLYAGKEAQDGGTIVSANAGVLGAGVLSSLTTTEMDTTETGLLTGFGTRIVGGAIFGLAAPDLLVTKPDIAKAFLYRDGTGGLMGSPNVTITGNEPRNFGTWASVADFNGDAKPDLAISENGNGDSSGWVFFQNGTNQFDLSAGNGFWQARFQSVATATNKGICTAAGDFDGDGVMDLAMGDSGNSPGKVSVWH